MKLNLKYIFIALFFGMSLSGMFGLVLTSCERWYQFEGSPDGWLSYWGGILGSSIGVFGSLFILREQMKVEKVDNTFFNLLTIHNEILNSIRVLENSKKNIFYIILLLMERESTDLNRKNIKKKKAELFLKNKEHFIEYISLIQKDISELILNLNGDLNQSDNCRELQKVEALLSFQFLKFKNEMEQNDIDSSLNTLETISNFIFQAEEVAKLSDIDRENFDQFKRLYIETCCIHYIEMTKGQKKEIVEKVLKDYYEDIGNYFRIFHRIIKFVNENVQDDKIKKDYIGFLRAMINEKEMLVIFYNAVYSDRGEGLHDQLKLTNFYGDTKDLPDEDEQNAQHFDKGSLLWEQDDIKIMRGFGFHSKTKK